MKKLSALLLAGFIATLSIGCGDEKGKTKTVGTTKTEEVKTKEKEATKPADAPKP